MRVANGPPPPLQTWRLIGTDLIAKRKSSPGNDIISVVAGAHILDDSGERHGLTDLELLMFFNLLVVAGSETTRNSIALGMVALINHQDQLRSLRDDRSLMPSAVEEILEVDNGHALQPSHGYS